MKKRTQEGFISTIILAIVALALLKYFLNWDVFDAATSEQGRSTIGYVRDVLNTIWSYISAPVTFAWNSIIWPVLEFAWQSFQALMEEAKDAAATSR